MKKPITQADGATAERSAIRTKVRRERMLCKACGECSASLLKLLGWLNKRDERYKARPGGRGKEKRAQ